MAYMKSTGEPVSRTLFTASINPELYDPLRDKCRAEGIQISTILECFMRQYVNEEFPFQLVQNYIGPTVTLGTTVNKEIVDAFKRKCKSEGNTIKIVLESFITLYNEGKYELALRRKGKQ